MMQVGKLEYVAAIFVVVALVKERVPEVINGFGKMIMNGLI